jgi:chemotaxis protein methyltransferase CheR
MPAAAKYHVLCVDDSPTIQTLIKKIFSEDPNCEKVSVANNGKEAREKLDSGKYDLITLDIHMPIMGGVEFLETQYRRKIDPPVLMVSSVNRTDVDLATKSLSLGAFDYVEKPAMNNLKKSVDEILTKAKMAMRSRQHATTENAAEREAFDQSISQKIVVPDASVCLRWVRGSTEHLHLIEAVVRGQNHEYRSPALVVCVSDAQVNGLESLALKWTERTVTRLHEGNHFLRPNQIYLCAETHEAAIVEELKVNNLSLQILAEPKTELRHFARFHDTQVLVDESVAPHAQSLVTRSGLAVSDITPATSFASLSLEYFAKLRKAKAA